MSLFFLSFIGIYAAMHYVVWRGVRPLLIEHRLLIPLALGWMLLMIAAPVLARLLERSGWDLSARIVAWTGYLWLGFLFIAFCLFGLRGLGTLALSGLSRIIPALTPGHPGSVQSAGLVLLLTLLLGVYALFEAATLRTETVRLVSPALPPGIDALRIVQISDLHLGLIHRQGTLREVVRRVVALRPDLLVVTGDLVDARLDHLDELLPLLGSLDPPLGKYAVLGNHEVYVGLKPSLDFLRQGGFTVLRNRLELIRPGLSIAGVDDPATGRTLPEEEILPQRKEGFTLLLKHRPAVAAQSARRFDLQLSGHAHRGQIFPFSLITGWYYPQQNGLYRLAGGAFLYASRGTGTWGPPMRLFAPPEITLLLIERPR